MGAEEKNGKSGGKAMTRKKTNPFGRVRDWASLYLARLGLTGVLALSVWLMTGLSGNADTHGETSSVALPHSLVRLVGGGQAKTDRGTSYLAGIHLRLKSGWKTYWRSPGEAGVPPRFDWSKSENVARVHVLWPAPKRFKDAYSVSAGYKHEVLFPLIVEPKDPAKPVILRLSLFYGICKELCVPAEANLKLPLPAEGDRALIQAFLKKVPGKAAPAELRIVKIMPQLKGKTPHLLVDVAYPSDAKDRDLFVEAGEDYYLPMAERVTEKGEKVVRYRIDLPQGEQLQALLGRSLRFTLVSTAGQKEERWSFNHPTPRQ